ncbi:MAG: exosortase A, partial [Chromatocurvus sp.]
MTLATSAPHEVPGIHRHAGPVLAAGLCLAVLALYLPTVASMVSIWIASETFTHGFLIVPISLWLVWRDRARLARLPLAPFYPALVLVLGAAMLWLVADLVSVLVVQQLALVALLITALWTLLGTALVRALAFPLGFLFLAVPMGKGLEPPMMDLTAEYTVRLIRLSGVPVYRENLFFMLPSGNWSVVEACSGVRYLIASFTLGLLYAYLSYRSPWRRGLFVLAAIIVPIVANVLRAYGIVMIGHFSNMQLATGVDHLIYGWVFFGVVMLLLFWIGGFWQESGSEPGSDPSGSPAGAREEHGPLRANPTDRSPSRTVLTGQLVIATLLALLAAAVGPLTASLSAAEAKLAAEPLSVPAAPAGWTVTDAADMPWQPAATGAQRTVSAIYLRDGVTVGLWLQQFLQQSQGAELVDSFDRWAAAEGDWRVLSRERVSEPAAALAEVEQVTLRHLQSGREFLGWFWYRV